MDVMEMRRRLIASMAGGGIKNIHESVTTPTASTETITFSVVKI
jgi:hypothetical protein